MYIFDIYWASVVFSCISPVVPVFLNAQDSKMDNSTMVYQEYGQKTEANVFKFERSLGKIYTENRLCIHQNRFCSYIHRSCI